jgi:hypothetical protein
MKYYENVLLYLISWKIYIIDELWFPVVEWTVSLNKSLLNNLKITVCIKIETEPLNYILLLWLFLFTLCNFILQQDFSVAW